MKATSISSRVRVFGIVGLAAALSAAPAAAATITFNLTGSGGTGTVGNSRTFTNGGVTVTATAWSYGADFQQGALGQWSSGLGVCNQAEISSQGCSSPEHQVDNAASYLDYVLFQFSTPVDPLSLLITTTSGDDLDASYWVGTLTLPADRLEDDSFAALAGRGFGARIDSDYGGSADSRTVTLTSGLVTGLLFGAKASGSNDAFKITSLILDKPNNTTVPEPASLVIFGVAMLGLAPRLRRRMA